MIRVNIFEVKAKLSEYLDRAARGDRILIYRHNKPVAELRAVEETPTEPRPIGLLPGRPAFKLPPSFFQPLPDDEVDFWEGKRTPRPAGKPKVLKRAETGTKRRPGRGQK